MQLIDSYQKPGALGVAGSGNADSLWDLVSPVLSLLSSLLCLCRVLGGASGTAGSRDPFLGLPLFLMPHGGQAQAAAIVGQVRLRGSPGRWSEPPGTYHTGWGRAGLRSQELEV